MKPMRRDASLRRAALINAASQCFAESGFGVPLEDIAVRAGVGRGTLYRNFKDRMALAIAIFEHEVDLIEERLDRDGTVEQTIADMVRHGAGASALFSRLTSEISLDGDNLAAFDRLGARLENLLLPLVEGAQARGELRFGVTPQQVLLAMRMVSGSVLPNIHQREVGERINEALDLLMLGLRPR
ncbi:TetR/AcrR family transcriptional regulator [Sphingomonas ginkgonis]|uniref:TetR/AcrR family transcriptional regulator n=1 Tax=Sphingomonas ginkgonis TaxID=2315330 RepID=A0A429VBQ8_9SPHN|nr:TetR/AcrR family transcriptional regulator [Sphingomonas ginkgonis]RST31316.1 TetR/AcrR family transcriptional regulator [Sphingomonas ginkgonis]